MLSHTVRLVRSRSEMFDVILILGWVKGLFLGLLCTILNILVFIDSFVCVNLSYKYFAYILNPQAC